jgi:CIC family chloride channel protein
VFATRTRFVAGLAGVALGAAIFAVAFRAALAFVYRELFHADNVVAAMAGLSPWRRAAILMTGAAVAGVIARLRSAPAQGVSNVMEAVALGNVRLSMRTTLSRVLASWCSIATGLSIGREGPLIEFGGSLGALAGRAATLTLGSTRALVAAGTAAGFAAAYNTPFAAVIFVLETIVGVAALEALLPVMAASAVATLVTRATVGGGPIYGQRSFALQSPLELAAFAGLGLVAALAAVSFKRVLGSFEHAFERGGFTQPWRATLGGVLVGALAAWIPDIAGNGYEPLNLILDDRLAVSAVLALIVVKVVATSASVASGVPGGIFTPVLLVGGGVGLWWAHMLAWLGIVAGASPGGYALVGMAATAAASLHAPLTAAVLVFELSGDYPIVLPLLVATVVATAASRLLGSASVYEAELRRKGLGWELTLEGRRITSDTPPSSRSESEA